MIGQPLGPYRVLAKLGEGGMGEVYRARDTRLGRDVAIKILPEAFALDRERLARFEQEARVVAALNHANIMAVYDVGTGPDGAPYLVSELMEGQTLRALLDSGPVPPRKAVDLGVQIAQGLAAAHEKGVLHRDLKPENVFVTRDHVKILDFGLAKLVQAQPAAAETVTHVASATEAGLVMGTVGYMSPEQVHGGKVDHRSDIFSLGVVLYELVAGRRPFLHSTSAETMTAILREDPPELPASAPEALRQIVARCLEKEPQNRFDSARDLAFALRTLGGSGSTWRTEVRAASAPQARYRWVVAAMGTILALLAAFGWVRALETLTGVDLSAYRLTPFATDSDTEMEGVWSPDGNSVVYRKESGGGTTLMVRGVDSPVATPLIELPGDRDYSASRSVFWSRDGNHVYYVAEGDLWMIARAGGDPQRVLERVAMADLSPDGKTLAVWRIDRLQWNVRASLWISSPPGAAPHEYLPAPFAVTRMTSVPAPRFSPDGTQIFVPGGWVAPYPADGKTQPRLVADLNPGPESSVSWMLDSRHVITSSPSSVDIVENSRGLRMIDTKTGRTLQLTAGLTREVMPSVSPNGRRIVFTARSADVNVMELPLDGSAPRAILASSRNEFSPAWSPDGTQIVYSTDRSGPREIWVHNAAARWERVIVTKRDLPEGTTNLTHPIFSPDGSRVAFVRYGKDGPSVWIAAALGGNAVPVTTEYSQAPSWSPDGKMLAVLTTKTAPWQIALVPVGSHQTLRLPENSPSCTAPHDWSPTGEWIACETERGITALSPDGKNSRLLPKLNSLAVSFSRDGTTLYSACEENGRAMLKAIDMRTGTVRTIADYGSQFRVNGGAQYHARMSAAPDGKRLITSVLIDKADLWLLEGFPQPRSWWALWSRR